MNIYLIEYTKDGTKGIQDAIKRFQIALEDTRKKVAFVDTEMLGEKRTKKLSALGVEIKDYRALQI